MQVTEQQGLGLGRGLVAQIQGREDGVGDQRGIPNLGKLDQPWPALEAPPEIGRNADGKAGLADTTWPNQAYQARRGKLLSQFGELAAAPDEAGRFGRQVASAASEPAHDGYECITACRRGWVSTQSGIPRISAVRVLL